MKYYNNLESKAITIHAAEAMAWHRSGVNIEAITVDDNNNAHAVLIHGAKQPAQEDENRRRCRHIADELEAYVNGEVYRCPDCGEIIHLSENVGDKYRCPDCETVHDVDDLEQLGVWDYMEDVLDIEYRIGSDKGLRSVQVMVAFGGPNIYIDTASASVELYWWGDRASYAISRDARDAVDEWAEELFSCL